MKLNLFSFAAGWENDLSGATKNLFKLADVTKREAKNIVNDLNKPERKHFMNIRANISQKEMYDLALDFDEMMPNCGLKIIDADGKVIFST